MKMKSVRIDFPAAGVAEDTVIAWMQDAFIAGATSKARPKKRELYETLARAVVNSHVNEYDDCREHNFGRPTCGPVFYIP